jgi:hypothetical protein
MRRVDTGSRASRGEPSERDGQEGSETHLHHIQLRCFSHHRLDTAHAGIRLVDRACAEDLFAMLGTDSFDLRDLDRDELPDALFQALCMQRV